MICVVTTSNKAAYDDYGHRLHANIDNLPSDAELHWYIDGFKAPDHPRLTQIGVGKVPRLTAFRERYAHYIPPSGAYDVVRHATNVYVAHAALRNHDGIGVFIDPRYSFAKPPHEGWSEAALGDNYMAVLKRRGLSTDTSIWIVNCAHPEHAAFMDTWLEWYESAAFKGLANWTDGEALDATIRRFQKAGWTDSKIAVGSLSGAHEDKAVPILYAPISAFIE